MKKLLFLIILFLMGRAAGFAQQENKRVLILPLQNTVKSGDFAPEQVQSFEDLSFYGLYNFFVTLPFTDMPEREKLRRTAWDSEQVSTLGRAEKADYIVYGTFSLQGDRFEPEITINLKVWGSDRVVFSRSYNTRLDLDIFDTIDLMILDALEGAFKIKARIATLDFNNFQIGPEEYILYVNNKEMARVSDRKFALTLKVLADNDYTIQLERVKDNKIVLEEKLRLRPGESRWIGYQARGTVSLDSIHYKEKGRTYKTQVNGRDIQEGQSLEDLEVGIPYYLLIMDDRNLVQSRLEFSLRDGEIYRASPAVNWGGAWHARLWTGGGSMAGLGLEYYLSRPLWLGVHTGFSFWSRQISGELVTLYSINPGIEAGYFLLGHMAQDFRLGLGIQLSTMIALPADAWQTLDPASSSMSLIPGLFLNTEWRAVTLRLLVVKDSSVNNLYFQPSLGLKF